MTELNRRQFLKGSILGASYALIATPALAGLAPGLRQEKRPAKTLIKRKLGKTGIELPVVSMGVMRADNPALVKAALESGMIHLDTAHGYMRGRNETMLGDLLKDYPRQSFILATKVPPEGSKEAYLEKLDLSLQRLRMSYVDILYLHGVSSRGGALDPEMIAALTEAKKSGKVRHVGMSTHKNEPEVLLAAIESGFYEVVLTSYNFKQPHAAQMREAIAKAADAGIGIVGMKSMAGAFHDRDRTKPINCKAALKWVLQDPNVTTTIPGISTFDQLAENAAVNEDITLTTDEAAAVTMGKSEGSLYCPGCDTCVGQCRNALPIPDLMRAYMYTYGYGDASMAKELLASLNVSRDPCRECGACTVACESGFNVAERITDVARLADVPAEFLA